MKSAPTLPKRLGVAPSLLGIGLLAAGCAQVQSPVLRVLLWITMGILFAWWCGGVYGTCRESEGAGERILGALSLILLAAAIAWIYMIPLGPHPALAHRIRELGSAAKHVLSFYAPEIIIGTLALASVSLVARRVISLLRRWQLARRRGRIKRAREIEQAERERARDRAIGEKLANLKALAQDPDQNLPAILTYLSGSRGPWEGAWSLRGPAVAAIKAVSDARWVPDIAKALAASWANEDAACALADCLGRLGGTDASHALEVQLEKLVAYCTQRLARHYSSGLRPSELSEMARERSPYTGRLEYEYVDTWYRPLAAPPDFETEVKTIQVILDALLRIGSSTSPPLVVRLFTDPHVPRGLQELIHRKILAFGEPAQRELVALTNSESTAPEQRELIDALLAHFRALSG